MTGNTNSLRPETNLSSDPFILSFLLIGPKLSRHKFPNNVHVLYQFSKWNCLLPCTLYSSDKVGQQLGCYSSVIGCKLVTWYKRRLAIRRSHRPSVLCFLAPTILSTRASVFWGLLMLLMQCSICFERFHNSLACSKNLNHCRITIVQLISPSLPIATPPTRANVITPYSAIVLRLLVFTIGLRALTYYQTKY